MQKLIITIGLPGAGKSTVSKSFAEKYGYVYINPDDIYALKDNIQPRPQALIKEVWDEVAQKTTEALKAGKTVLVDGTFVKKSKRQEFVDIAQKAGISKVTGLYVKTPIDIAKERNLGRDRVVPEEIIERKNLQLKNDFPGKDDGLSEVFYLNENMELTKAITNNETKPLVREFKVR